MSPGARLSRARSAAPQDRILVAVDFSRASRAAFRVARDLARRLGAALEVIHVIPKLTPTLPRSPTARELVAELQGENRRAAEHGLEKLVRNAGDLPVRSRILVGVAHRQILDHAEKRGVSLIVLAKRGQNLAERLLLGSTADRVLRKATIPVVVVPVPSNSSTADDV